jgi:S1-C subfamily serine protease
VQGDDNDGTGTPPDDNVPGDEGPMRGWVPPDDRLWLHPSERSSLADRSSFAAAPRTSATRPSPRAPWVIGGLGMCVIVTLVVSGMVLTVSTDATPPATTMGMTSGVPTTEVDLSHLTDTHRMDTLASSARDSTVALLVSKASGTAVGTGVVAEAGGIIVALEPTVAGARAITAIEQDGTRQPALLVATDPTSGIVVLRIPDDLPVAAFTTGDPATGSVAVAMSEEAGSQGGTPVTRLYAGTVLYSGIASGSWHGSEFCETAVAAPLEADDLGSPLVEPSGAVAGIFDAVVGTGSGRTAIFLPAELVRDVASELVSHGSVVHGSLGASVSDPPPSSGSFDTGTTGAVVTSVAAGGSAAQAGLDTGDRIVAIDGAVVQSVAELGTRLYADPPGTEIPMTYVRDGTVHSGTIVLGTP